MQSIQRAKAQCFMQLFLPPNINRAPGTEPEASMQKATAGHYSQPV